MLSLSPPVSLFPAYSANIMAKSLDFVKKKVSNAQQGCIYLIKIKVKTGEFLNIVLI